MRLALDLTVTFFAVIFCNMPSAMSFDSLFQKAVHAIDTGDQPGLKTLLDEHPRLVAERLYVPGSWLRDQLAAALDGFFKDPYLLWFVSEDAVRNKYLPPNITKLAETIIRKAKEIKAGSLQEQIDYTLRLVAWSRVARDCKVQIPLMELLVNEGAKIEGVSTDALVNGNFAAAEYLIQRGAKIDLPTALCMEKWEEADKLAISANAEQKQFSLILAALNGKVKAVDKLLGYGGVDIDKPSTDLYPHATALHHAVWSGSLLTVKRLVGAGARLDIPDSLYGGTPLDWAKYGDKQDIAIYLSALPKNV